MQSKASTVSEYLASLPPDRRAAIAAVRKVILDNLDKDYRESMQYGMIGYGVPHSVFPPGYHCNPAQPLPFAGLASQKSHMALYLMCVYGHNPTSEWFVDAWNKTGKKLDMGKSCIRFKKLDDLPLDVIGELIRRVPAKTYVEHCQKALEQLKKPSGKDRVTSTAPTKKSPRAAKRATRARRAASR